VEDVNIEEHIINEADQNGDVGTETRSVGTDTASNDARPVPTTFDTATGNDAPHHDTPAVQFGTRKRFTVFFMRQLTTICLVFNSI